MPYLGIGVGEAENHAAAGGAIHRVGVGPPPPPLRWLAPTDPAIPAPLRQLDRPPLQLSRQVKGEHHLGLLELSAGRGSGGQPHRDDHELAWAERLGRHMAEAGWP